MFIGAIGSIPKMLFARVFTKASPIARLSNVRRSYRVSSAALSRGETNDPKNRKLRGVGGRQTEFSVDRSGLMSGPDTAQQPLQQTLEESKQALFRVEQGLSATPEDAGARGELDWGVDDARPNEPIPANKEQMSELAKDLQAYIGMRGPISLHDYMLQASNHLIHGYYQTEAEKIGSKGDFITAPEMSQLFGEMIGMWCISHWMALGRPATIDLLELGPGKGTLMRDILQVAAKFPDFHSAIRVHFVELSDEMRDLQQTALGCKTGGDVEESDAAAATATAAKENDDEAAAGDAKEKVVPTMEEVLGVKSMTSSGGVPVKWYYSLAQVPEETGVASLTIAQEFLDAFPVHQFEYRQGLWRERLVDICRDESSDEHFKLVLSPSETPAVKALLKGAADMGASTHQDGEGIEVAPLALATCENIANRLCKNGGAALLVDYGENFTPSDTLRGFKQHKQVSALSKPGETDITADVDFAACARAAAKRGAVAVGAIPQGEFLVRMGIVDRVQALISQPHVSDEKAYQILASLRQLIDGNDMGSRFKVLALYDPRVSQINTIGFPDVLKD